MTNNGSASLYLQVARTLQDRIATGAHPIGSLLPTEHMLAEEFGVSRQTVRQAIGHLRGMKLLSARKGVGTRVEANRPQTSYYHTLQSLQDLFQFASDAQYRVTSADMVSVTGKEAEELGCRPGRQWLRLVGLRELPGESRGPLGADGPLCLTTVMIDGRYADVAATPRVHTRAIFAQIEDRFGVSITEVHQDIEATLVTEEQAALLRVEPGSPALLITRRYVGSGRTLVDLSRNLHPGGRFRYAMTVRREG